MRSIKSLGTPITEIDGRDDILARPYKFDRCNQGPE